MKVINIALKREDGKVECDTVYSEKTLTREDLIEISCKFNCDVMASHVGIVEFFTDEVIKQNTIIYEKEKVDGTEKDTNTVCEPSEATSDTTGCER